MRRLAACVLLSGSLISGGCGSDLVTTPSDMAVTTLRETFTGTLERNFAFTHPFGSAPGTVTATLTSLSPDSTVVIGLSLGTWNGQSCQIVLANDNAVQGTVVIGNASAPGNLCVRIYDVGKVVEPESYQVDVVHN